MAKINKTSALILFYLIIYVHNYELKRISSILFLLYYKIRLEDTYNNHKKLKLMK